MKIGVLLPLNDADGPGGTRWPVIREVALAAEAGGLDSVWAYDHLLFRLAGEPEGGPHEAMSVLAAVAAVTRTVHLGTIVLGTAFRSPGIIARAAATVDEISDGRLTLGLGTGWHEPEYAAFGYPFDHRAGRFEEFLSIAVPLVRGERVTFHGTWHDAEDAVILPPPPRPARLPGRMPVLIAAKGERVMRLTARWADAWNVAWFGLPEDRFFQRRTDLHAACEAEGRDPATLDVTVGLVVDGESATGARPLPPGALPADVDAVASALDAWRDLGVAHVQVDMRPAGLPMVELVAKAAAKHRGMS